MRGGVGSRDSRGGPGGNDGLDGLPTLVTADTKGGAGKYIKTIIYDAQGRIASAALEGTVGGTTPSRIGTAAEGSSEAVARVDHVHAPSGSIMDAWKVEAAADLGVTPDELIFLITGDGGRLFASLVTSVTAGGVVTYSPDLHGWRLSTGGGAGGLVLSTLGTVATGTIPLTMLAGANDKWWMKARMRLNTTVGAGTILGAGSRSALNDNTSANDLMMGAAGSFSTTNFSLTGSAGTGMDSGTPLDTLVRDHKGWRTGAVTRYRIDSLAVLTGDVAPATAGRFTLEAYDSAAVLQTMDVYVAAVAFPARALGA